MPRQRTFPLFLVPAILVVLLSGRRVGRSAGLPGVRRYYLLQAVIAWRARRWGWVALLTGIGLAMAVAVLGIPT